MTALFALSVACCHAACYSTLVLVAAPIKVFSLDLIRSNAMSMTGPIKYLSLVSCKVKGNVKYIVLLGSFPKHDCLGV